MVVVYKNKAGKLISVEVKNQKEIDKLISQGNKIISVS